LCETRSQRGTVTIPNVTALTFSVVSI